MGAPLADYRSPAASSLLAVVALLALAAALPVAYANRTLLDSDEFAARTSAVMDDPVVEDRIVDDLTDTIIDAQRELLTYRPALRSIVRSIVTSSATESLVETVVAGAHRSLLEPDSGIVVTIDDLALLARTQIAAVAPELLDNDGAAERTEWRVSADTGERIADTATRMRSARLTLLVIAALALVGTAWLASDRKYGVIRAGRAVFVAGLTVTAGWVIARIWFVGRVEGPDSADLAAALWSGYLGGMLRWSLLLTAAGLIVAGLAGWNPLREATWHTSMRTSDGVGTREALTAIAVLLAGLWAITQPLVAAQLLVTVAAGTAVVAATRTLVNVVRTALARRRAATSDSNDPSPDTRSESRRHLWFAAGGVALLSLVVAGVAMFSDADSPDATTDERCNGSLLYCDIPLHQLTTAATHNSMSAASDGYFRANHDTGIIDQLDAGYRGLLLDTWYGYESLGDVVITDRINVSPVQQAELEAELGADGIARAEAAQERQLGTSDDREMFLCHGYCELGATPLIDELHRIATWLDTNRREVLVIIIQDEVSPEDTAEAFEQAGLAELAIELDIERPIPTLGEMITAGTPLLVMMENATGDVPWLHDAFTFTQDTPYANATPEDFRCNDNRGTPDSPFLLINHFVSSPDPVAADTSNTYASVSAALNDCGAARGAWPSMIAVDYWSRGDVLSAVAAENLLAIDLDDS